MFYRVGVLQVFEKNITSQKVFQGFLFLLSMGRKMEDIDVLSSPFIFS